MLLSIGDPTRRTGSASSPHSLSLFATISDAILHAPFLCPYELLFSWPLSLPRSPPSPVSSHIFRLFAFFPPFRPSHSFSARLLVVLLFLFLHLFLLSTFVRPPLWHPPLPLPSPMRSSFSCSYSFFPPSSMCLLLLPSPFSPLLSVLSHPPPPASFPFPLLLRHPHFAEVPLKTVRTVAYDR